MEPITRRAALVGGAASLVVAADALARPPGPRGVAILSQGVRAIDPALLFERDPARKGCVLDFTAAALTDGLLFAGSTTGGAAPTSGQTIALALARRHTDPLGAGLGSNIVVNGDFSSAENWTLGAGVSITGGELVFNTGIATYALATQSPAPAISANTPYKVGFSVKTTLSRDVSVSLGGVLGSAYTSGDALEYLVPTGSAGYYFWPRGASAVVTGSIDDAFAHPIPARAARQGTSSLRPIWSSNNGGKAIFDGVDDVLPITFPGAFTGETIVLAADGSITQASGVSIGTTYNFAISCKMAVLIETLTAAERAGVVAYLKSLPIS